MRRFVAVCGIIVGTLMVGACGGARLEAREPESNKKDPLGLMPEEAFALVQVDVARLRSSPYRETVAGWYRKWAEFAAESDDELRGARVVEEMLSHADTIVGGVEAPDEKGDAGEPDFVVVTRGEFQRGQIKSWLAELPQMGDAVEVVERDHHRVLLVQGVAGIQLDVRTWAWTPADRVPALLERLRSPGQGPRSEALRAMYDRLDAEDTGLRVALETKPSLREELEAEQLLDAPWKKSLRVSGFRMSVSQGVDMEFVGVTKNAETARRLRDALAEMTARYKSNPFTVLLGFDMLLESTEWNVEGDTAVAQSTLDDTQTRQLLFHLERLGRGVLGLIQGGASGALDALGGDIGDATPDAELAPTRTERKEASVSSIVGDVQRFRVPVGDTQPTKGLADAPVTIVVFSDFQCPYCARVRERFERVRRKYGDDVRVVWRNRPLPFHRKARPAARAAMEAYEQGGDEMFWKMHRVLFDNQESLSRADLETYAEQVGLDMKAFRSALDDKEHASLIEADEELAGRLQIRGTPQMFINGRRLRGAKPFSELEKIIDDELRRAKRLRARGVSRERVYATFMKHADSEPKPRTPDRGPREEHDLRVPEKAGEGEEGL